MNPVIKAQHHRNQWSALFIFIPLSASRRRAGSSRPGGRREEGVSPGAAAERGWGWVPVGQREAAGSAARLGSARRAGAARSGRRLLLGAASRQASPGLSQHFPAASDAPLRTKRTMQPGSRTQAMEKKIKLN